MRLSELTNNVEKAPHLYLDMDGVQADFFGAWANMHNVSNYKEIPNSEDAINKLAQSGYESVYNFFRDLKPLHGGQIIIKWLHTNKVPFTVLSAPLRGPFSKASVQAKRDWLDQYNPGTSSSAIFTSAKFKYATTDSKPNVLVDDYGKYLDAWKNAGGISIKHSEETTAHTIDELKKIYG